MSSISYKQNNFYESVRYGQEALNNNFKSDHQELRRDIYLLMDKSYLELNKTDSAKIYLEKYSKLNDSILANGLNKQTKAVNHLIKKNDEENSQKINKIILISILSFASIIGIISLYIRKRSLTEKKKYDELLDKIKKEQISIIQDLDKKTEEVKTVQNISIHNETLYQILNGLSKFEKSKGYLSKNLSLTTLSNDLHTNTKYLSQIINEHKGKLFNNYINYVIINYICQELYNKPELRKYKISAIAELCGFSSREVFTSVFKKETDLNPSVFIKNLETNNATI